MPLIKVLLADDHPLVLDSLRRLLEDQFTIVGAVSEPSLLMNQATSLRPDVLLLDACFSNVRVWDLLAELKANCPRMKVIMVTMLAEAIAVSEAFRRGAQGYVLKQSASQELHEAIQAVMRNKRYVSKTITQEVRESIQEEWMRPEGYSGELSSRQREVLRLLGAGRSSKSIAETLKISHKTVEFHRMNMARKLGVRTTAELVKFALDRGIISL